MCIAMALACSRVSHVGSAKPPKTASAEVCKLKGWTVSVQGLNATGIGIAGQCVDSRAPDHNTM